MPSESIQPNEEQESLLPAPESAKPVPLEKMMEFKTGLVTNLPFCRIVVNEMVYHQDLSAPVTGAPHKYSRWLRSDAQPYIRRLKVSPVTWEEVDLNWLKKEGVSILYIVSEDKSQQTRQPVQDAPTPYTHPSKTILLGVEGSAQRIASIEGSISKEVVEFGYILPGESGRISPEGRWYIKSVEEMARCVVYAYPR
jgi:hypothetical protein